MKDIPDIVGKKIKNILAYLSPSLLSALIPFVTLPIMTRFLEPKDFGIIALANSFPSLIISLVGCNVDTAAHRYYFEYRKNSLRLCRLINSTVTFLLCVFALSAGFVFFGRNFFSRVVMGNSEHGPALFLAYVTVCLSVLVTFYLTMYRDMERAKTFSKFTIMRMIINSSLILILVAVFRIGYMGVVYGSFISVLVMFCILSWQFHKEFPFSFNIKMLIDNLKYGVPLLADHFTGSVYQFLDKYMLRSIISLSSTGIYSIAQNISTKLFVFMTAIQSTFHPIFMKDMFDKGKEAAVSVGRNFTVFTYLSLSAVLGMILFGEEIVRFLAPPSYYNAINVMLILLCGVSMQAFGKVVGLPLAYVKKAYLGVPISFGAVVVNVLFNLLLIPRWSTAGAGLATVATIFMTNLAYLVVAQRHYRIIYEKKILFLFYSNVFLSAMALIFFRECGVQMLIKYGFKVISLSVFVVLGMRANIITKRNIEAALNIFIRKKKYANA